MSQLTIISSWAVSIGTESEAFADACIRRSVTLFPAFYVGNLLPCWWGTEIRGYSRSLDYWKHPWQAWPLPQISNKLKSSRQSGLVSYFHFLTYDSIYRTTATCCDQDVFSCLKMPMFAPSLPTPSNCKYADFASQSQLMLVKDHRICTWTHITSLSHLFRVDVITDHHRGAVTLPCYALGNLLPCSPSFSRSYLSRVAQVKTLLNRVSSRYLYSTLTLLRLRTLNMITAPKYCYSFAC